MLAREAGALEVVAVEEIVGVEGNQAAIVPLSEAPTGVGEPGVPAVAPAVANAMARLTGKRPSRLHFMRAG